MNKKIKIIFVMVLSVVQNKSMAEDNTSQAIQITAVEPEFTDKQTYIHIQFDKAPHWEDNPIMEDHKTFLQLNLKGIDPRFPGKFWDVNSKAISKVALFKSSSSDTAIRIFPQEENQLNLSDVSIEHLGSRVIISARHPAYAERIPSSSVIGPPYIRARKDTVVNLGEIGDSKSKSTLAVTKGSEEIQGLDAPDDVGHRENQAISKKDAILNENSENSIKHSEEIQSILIKIVGFLAAIILLGLLIITKRKLAVMKSLEMGVEKMPNILNLSTLPLSQKQKISLIQVGTERFLIGVSPGEIRLLTEIASGSQLKFNEKAPISRFQTELLQQDYKATHVGKHTSLAMETAEKKDERSVEKKILDPLRPKVKSAAERMPRSNRMTEPNRVAEVVSHEGGRTPPRVRIEISDEGIKNLSPRNMNDDSQKKSHDKKDSVVDDVTKLIRQRISGLKNI